MNGFLLALQFFTIFPIKKELPLEKKDVSMMYCLLPVVGLFIGSVTYGVYIVSDQVLGLSFLLTAVLLVVTGFVLTGGLHLDGWADTADAFFSYKDPEKRFDVLEDPRLGAFGTMALILLVIMKVALVYEAMSRQITLLYAFLFIPIVARALLNICFVTLPAGKKQGIAFFLKERLAPKPVVVSSVCIVVVTLGLYGLFWEQWLAVLVCSVFVLYSIYYFKRWVRKNFHGITGDLAGAFIEGMEVFLWFLALFLL